MKSSPTGPGTTSAVRVPDVTRLLFAGGRLFEETGADPGSADVVVDDGRFAAVGSGLDGDEVVDCTGATLLPGLFDCHVHVVVSSVDPMRNAQTPFSYPFYQAIGKLSQTGGHGDGWMPSGRELPLISPHPGRPATIADGPAEVRRVVRELIRAGADVIKVATSGGVL